MPRLPISAARLSRSAWLRVSATTLGAARGEHLRHGPADALAGPGDEHALARRIP